jgi:uncharacterized protein
VIIDIHSHAFTDSLAPRAIPQLAALSGFTPRFDGTVAGLLAEDDAAGIDVTVVQPVATKPSQVRTINDWAAAAQTDRVLFFGAMHPDFEAPAAELARVKALGLHGIKLHTEYQRFVPDEERMAPIYEAAIEQDLPILFHAGEDEFMDTLFGACEPFARALRRWEGMTAILAHMGGYKQWAKVRECIAGLDCYLDTSYSLGHMPDEEFLAVVAEHGYQRILFGSDEPWDAAGDRIAHLRRLPLSSEKRDAILGGNAAALLGIG